MRWRPRTWPSIRRRRFRLEAVRSGSTATALPPGPAWVPAPQAHAGAGPFLLVAAIAALPLRKNSSLPIGVPPGRRCGGPRRAASPPGSPRRRAAPPEPPQGEAVGDHAHAAEGHGGAGEDRGEEEA